MKWIKISDQPPSHVGWLCCPGCGWMALETDHVRVFGCEVGEPCQYCKTPMVRATEEDMKRSYPNGVYDQVNNDGTPLKIGFASEGKAGLEEPKH